MLTPKLRSRGPAPVGRVVVALLVGVTMGAARDVDTAPAFDTAPPQVTTIRASAYDDIVSERWADGGVFVLRREGPLIALAVTLTFGGTAVRNVDYVLDIDGTTVRFGPGQVELWIAVSPIADALVEGSETVTMTVTAGRGYIAGGPTTATISLYDEVVGGRPGPEEAARFLGQATFGPWQDSAGDPDGIPEDVEDVMSLGIGPWIEDQFARPIGLHQPFVEWVAVQPASAEIYVDPKQAAWWGRAMGVPLLRPDLIMPQLPDPLRQRVAFALSEIFVISDRMEAIGVSPEGMANFYDSLVSHAFGNYRDILREVALHPCMGLYLSHLGNRKATPGSNVFPDENFARELMQLFTIGLWQLHPNGSLQRDANGQPIETYDNTNITELARVFTGLAFGGTNTAFGLWPRDFTVPMKAWDAEHDCDPKTLLLGGTLPARVPSPGSTGTATLADLDGALDNLVAHPNLGPFVGKQLIQRLVTSNPSAGYIERVSAAFADNGLGVRGDMKAVIRAILLDPEARDPVRVAGQFWGKPREPFLKAVAVARAFAATSAEGWYYLDSFQLDHGQEPFKSPSVFNFFLPSHSPPGYLTQRALVAPEFQIITASTGVLAANYFFGLTTGGMHRWGQSRPERVVHLDLAQEMLLNVPAVAVNDPYPSVAGLDPDPLLRRLDLVLTGGALRPETYQILREALLAIGPFSGWDWPRRRLDLAIYLVVQSAEFSVQR